MDLYDLMHVVNSDPKKARPKPYPRPWATAADTQRRIAKSELTREETLAALRYAGHTNLPSD